MDTIEHKGLTFRVSLEHDDSHGAPWEECDGHGPVRESTDASGEGRFKRPGERILYANRRDRVAWVYDWQEAMRLAKTDGWGIGPDELAALTKRLGRDPTPGEVRQAAVQADFDYLRRYVSGDWSYVGVVVTLLDVDGEPTRETASLWGIESDAYDYHAEVARECAAETASRIGRRKYLETKVKVRK